MHQTISQTFFHVCLLQTFVFLAFACNIEKTNGAVTHCAPFVLCYLFYLQPVNHLFFVRFAQYRSKIFCMSLHRITASLFLYTVIATFCRLLNGCILPIPYLRFPQIYHHTHSELTLPHCLNQAGSQRVPQASDSPLAPYTRRCLLYLPAVLPLRLPRSKQASPSYQTFSSRYFRQIL